MTWASILKVILPYLFGMILGAVICYVSMPDSKPQDPYLVVKHDTTMVTLRDTIRLKPQTIIRTVADTVFTTQKGNIKSKFKGETDGVC